MDLALIPKDGFLQFDRVTCIILGLINVIGGVWTDGKAFFRFCFHMLYAIPNLPNAAEEDNLDHGWGLDASAYGSQIKSHHSNSLALTARILLTLAIIH